MELLRRASVIGAPVRTRHGRDIGVLIAASTDPERPLLRADVATLEALAAGLIEARSGGELFGTERLGGALERAARAGLGAQEIVRALHAEVRDWTGGVGDDAFAIALRHRPSASAPHAG